MVDVTGTAGNDSLNGSANADLILGLEGNDTLNGLAGNDVMDGGADNDRLFGGDGNDDLKGGSGHDSLDGGNHNDTLYGGLGDDTMIGGSGDDVYYVDSLNDIVTEALSAGNDTVHSSISLTLAANVETLYLKGYVDSADIDGTGNALNNVLHGNESTATSGGRNLLQGLAGNDTLYGYNGEDTLDGGTGNDVMYGGKHSDVFIVDSAGDQVIEYADGGDDDTVHASINYTLYDPVTSNYIENVTLTGTANLSAFGNSLSNTLTGNQGNNWLSGGAGHDVLRGQALGELVTGGNDTLDGGAGNDTMYGGLGDDLYYVDGSGDDVIEQFDQGIDTVISTLISYDLEQYVENLTLAGSAVNGNGNGEHNILIGNGLGNDLDGESNNDTLYGGAGNDTLSGGLGNDVMYGGAGNDIYYVNSTADVTDESDLAANGIDLVYASASHTLGTGIENLTITASTSVNGTGNALANILTGGTGNNILDGGAANDTLYGGSGHDTLIGGDGVDSLVGGTGNDTFVLDSLSDIVVEAASGGTDTVEIAASYTLSEHLENLTLLGTGNFSATGNGAANELIGNAGNNQMSGGAGNDKLYGGDGDDTLNGGEGADALDGGLGNDTYILDHANDKITELSTGGTDWVLSYVTHELGLHLEHLELVGAAHVNGTGNSKDNLIFGNAGNNLLSGENGNDSLTGNDGDDTLDGGVGADTMVGGAGNDTYVVDVANDVLVELANGGTDTVMSALSYTLANQFENLTLTGSAGTTGTGNSVANILTGNRGANRLVGNGGDDTLIGDAGADTLNGGIGNDVMSGGTGNDTYVIDSLGDTVYEAADEGTDTIQTIFTTVLGANFENLILTGSDDLDGTGNNSVNVLTGNAGANLLLGFAGNDTIQGGGGDDTMDGGIGNDSMLGGTGNDTYYVDATTDKIVEAAGGGTDLVYASASYTLASGVENIILTGSAHINGTGNSAANLMIGNAGNNSLTGGSGIDTIEGGAGNDTLNGGVGADSMTGGDGDDVYFVDNARDQVIELAGGGIDQVNASTSATLAANVENLTLTGTGTFRGTGNELDNVITGNKGKNTLQGMDGDDTLDGGLGADVLTGGAGADHFVFSTATAGNDTITDFTSLDEDKLVFAGLEVGTFVYLGGDAFSGGADNSEARFDSATAKLLVDVNGDGTADLTLTLTGVTQASQLTATDFIWS